MMNYYDDVKWCPKCKRYVRYMMSLHTSFCVNCDSKVIIFNRKDMKRFHEVPVVYED